MMTLDQLEDEVNQILTNFWSAQKSSGIKRLYKKIKTQIPDFPDINDSVFNRSATQAARNLLSNYAVHLYQQRLKEEGTDPQSEKQKLHSYLYDKNWREFFQMVQLEYIEQPSDNPSPMASPEKIVYNLEEYDENLDISPPSNSEKGAPLALNREAPISYVINIPPGEMKGIQVNVYGGWQKENRKKNLNIPGSLSAEDRALLAKGIAVVNLNLVDMLKLDVYQDLMPSHLHTELHDSINQFWETIHYKPETLSPLLSNMKEKAIFLRGASWGGRTAIRHAELYPNTFSGYISFDGSLSSEMASKSDKSLTGKRPSALSYLDPASHIADIQDPILLIHNANDNNVNIKVSLDFYEKAKKEGKENLLSVHINHKGNTYERNQGVWNTGHFSPNPAHAEFNTQVNAVSNFIIYGPDNMPELKTWRTLKYNTLSDRNYNLASASDLFVEYVNRTYQKELPNYHILSKIFSVFDLINQENANFIRSAFDTPIPDSALKAGLTQELKRINIYLKEKYDIEFDATITSEMTRVYQGSILNADAKLHRELLSIFILANPHYVDKIHSHVAGKPDYEDLKRDAFIKLLKQRSAFHAASKITLRSILKRGQAYEKQIETQIKNGDAKALRSLIDAYNASGNAQTLTERLDRIFSQTPENTKQDMLYKVGSEIIADLSMRNEIFEVLRKKMTSRGYESLLANSKLIINKMISRWCTRAETEHVEKILKDISPELKKEFMSINFLHQARIEKFENALSDLSNDEVYALFCRVDGKETALTSNHDISYLKYLKDRVGEERFKKLIEFEIEEGLKGSILKNYLQESNFESFEFLINHLSADALIEHIENNKNVSAYDDNLLTYLLAADKKKHFETLISKLQAEGKSSLLRALLLDKDNAGNSGMKHAIHSDTADSINNLQQILKFCTPEDLASELKSENSRLPDIMIYASKDADMKRKYNFIQDTLGAPLFKEVVSAQTPKIVFDMIKHGDDSIKEEIEMLLGTDTIKQCLENNLDELFSSLFINKNSIDLIREYYSKEDLGEKLAQYCADSLKAQLNSSWYSQGRISEILNCLKPKEYQAFQRQLLLDPDNFSTYFSLEKIESTPHWKDKVRDLFSAPDEMLVHIFSLDVLRLALNSNNASLQEALQDLNHLNKGINLSLIKNILSKLDVRALQFVSSPTLTSQQLSSAIQWKNESEQNFIVTLIFGVSNEDMKELISIGVLKNITHGSSLSILLERFSDDEVYALFHVARKETALTSNHDISYLKYLKDRVGEERFKKLIEFEIEEGLKGSILKNYLQENDFESFEFLINHLSADALIEHIENNKNVSAYDDNLLTYLLAADKKKHFETLISKLQAEGKSSLLRALLLDKDNAGNSGMRHAIHSDTADSINNLQQILKFCTPEDLASELKSENSRLPDIMIYASKDADMKRKYNFIQDTLGAPLFKEVVSAQTPKIVFDMIKHGDDSIKEEIEMLLGADTIRLYLENNLDELFSSLFINKNSIDLIREYYSKEDLDEKLAQYCTHFLKKQMNSSWYSQGRISEILNYLKPKEYQAFQRQLLLAPDNFSTYFSLEKIESTPHWKDNVRDLFSAPDEMISVLFNQSVLKSILAAKLQSSILSMNNLDLRNKPSANRILDLIYLTQLNSHLADCILAPSPQSLKKIFTQGIEPGDAFELYWKDIIFSMFTADELKTSLTSDVLKLISHPQILSDTVQILTDQDIFELFNQKSCKAVLEQYSEEMLKVIAARVGNEKFQFLIQDKIEEKSKFTKPTIQMFEHTKNNKSEKSLAQKQAIVKQSKNKKRL